MGRTVNNRFYFSENCYYDMESDTVIDVQNGKASRYTSLSALEGAVLTRLICKYPNAVTVDQLCELIQVCDDLEVRRVVSDLKKRHTLLAEWLPRCRNRRYCLREPAVSAQIKPVADRSAQQQTCALKSTGICVRPNFVREARLDIFAELDEAFRENHVVFLQGIGGIGKSEAAKHWALQQKKSGLFDTVVFAQLNSDTNNSNIQSLVADDTIFVISGPFRSRDEEESVEAYFNRKLAKIMQITDERTLVIIDNYDIDDPKLAALFSGPYRLLVTTRNKQKGYDFPLIPVTEIQETEHLKTLFFRNLADEREDIREEDPYLERLFSLVSNHTLTIEILAKSLVNSDDTPESLYRKIGDPEQHKRMRNVEGLVDRNFSEDPLSPFECIRRLFNLSRLEQDSDFEYKSQVLVFLSAMPTRGIELSLFKKWSDNRIICAKNSLVQKSWLRQDTVKGTTLLSMHPLICEVIWHDLKPTADKCHVLIDRIIQDENANIDYLYHEPRRTKDMYVRIVLSLLRAFPIQDLTNYDFYAKILTVLYACSNADEALNITIKIKNFLEQDNQTNTWRYAYILHQLGLIYSTLYLDREKSISFYWKAKELMESSASTAHEKTVLAILYREIAVTFLRSLFIDDGNNQFSYNTIEDLLNKGVALSSSLLEDGVRNRHLALHFGLSCIWRSRLEIYRGNCDQAMRLVDTAENEFIRHGYINQLDKGAVAETRGLIFEAMHKYPQSIEYFKKTIATYLDGFGEYNRSSIERAIKLATAYQNNNQPEEAVKVLIHYQKIAEEMLGEDASLAVTIRNKLQQLQTHTTISQ